MLPRSCGLLFGIQILPTLCGSSPMQSAWVVPRSKWCRTVHEWVYWRRTCNDVCFPPHREYLSILISFFIDDLHMVTGERGLGRQSWPALMAGTRDRQNIVGNIRRNSVSDEIAMLMHEAPLKCVLPFLLGVYS